VQKNISPLILTFGIADPVGSIGIQADLATFSSMNCHGLSVITSVLVSDTTCIKDSQQIDAECISDQARALLEDMPIAAFKVGTVDNVESVSVIAEIVSDYPEIPLILDPFLSIMPDIGQDSEDLLISIYELLIPQTSVMLLSTVDLSRLAEIWREPFSEDMISLDAMHIIELGCKYLLVTESPTTGSKINSTLFNESGIVKKDGWPRIPGSFIGSSATLSATTAAMLAKGLEIPEAISKAQKFTIATVAAAQRLGMGKLIPNRYFWTQNTEVEEYR